MPILLINDRHALRKSYRLRLVRVAIVSFILLPLSACGGQQVDSSLAGTWLLQWPGQPVYWKIDKNGRYEISGPGAAIKHDGTLRARKGKWSLKSKTWGDDGGTYSFPNAATMICVGKLGPGTWVRVTEHAAASALGKGLKLTTQRDGSRLLAKDLPEFMHAVTLQARALKRDAIPVGIDYKYRKYQTYTGPEVKISFYSPSEGTGVLYTATTLSVDPHVFDQAVNWGEDTLPPVFVDLPAALRIARENGLKGPLEKANLRIWSPDEAEPILAWMLSTGTHGGARTVNAATGELIDFDVTGYVAAYNAQWAEAAKGLRALLRSAHPRSSGSSSSSGGGSYSSGSGSGSDDSGGFDYDAYNQKVAEENAYWSGDSRAYDRIKSGGCTSSDSSRYGC